MPPPQGRRGRVLPGVSSGRQAARTAHGLAAAAPLRPLTLRYWTANQDLGLIEPSFIDADSGYRYFKLGQLPRVHRIVALRELGMSLSEISSLVDTSLDERIEHVHIPRELLVPIPTAAYAGPPREIQLSGPLHTLSWENEVVVGVFIPFAKKTELFVDSDVTEDSTIT